MQHVEEDAINEAVDAIRELSNYLSRVSNRHELGGDSRVKTLSVELTALAEEYTQDSTLKVAQA